VDRSQKEKLVASLNNNLKDAALVVVTQQAGLTVAEMTDLRRQMRAAGASFKVSKNRLTRRALEGTPFQKLSPMFKGPTAIAYSRDPVAAAKVAVEYANKNEKLTVVGGSLGERMLDLAGEAAGHDRGAGDPTGNRCWRASRGSRTRHQRLCPEKGLSASSRSKTL
jgi:large subunit ribosomal protein L10